MKISNPYLSKLEDIFAESDFMLRYEKGNFKSGYCVLKEQKVIVVNKFYPLEGKINCLIDILRSNPLDISQFKDKTKELYLEVTQPTFAF